MTGVFRFSQGRTSELKVAGESEPIRVTGLRPIWSTDREDRVPSSELRVGEKLSTDTRNVDVESISQQLADEPVYNIEVDEDHCYRVGEQGVLVHNASTPCDDEKITPGQKKILDKHDVEVLYPSAMQFKSGGAAAGSWLRFVFIRADKVVANLKYYPSSESRGPKPNMIKAIKQGLIATPVKIYALTGLPTVSGVTLVKSDDDVGHIVANQFGGYADMQLGNVNVFPQNSTVNQGPFKFFEQFTVAPKVKESECEVCIRITFQYLPTSSTPHRPLTFLYEWWIEDYKQTSMPVVNP